MIRQQLIIRRMSERLTHGSLFSGIEGFGLGAALAGIKTDTLVLLMSYGKVLSMVRMVLLVLLS